MIWHELRRMFAWRPVAVTLLLIVPFIIIVGFVPGIKKPITPPTDATEINAQILALPATFERLQRSTPTGGTQPHDVLPPPDTTKAILLQSWRWFGGLGTADDDLGSQYNAYYKFYRGADISNSDEMQLAYMGAQIAFANFYAVYNTFLSPIPTLFIKNSDYKNLHWGVQQLNYWFSQTWNTVIEANEIRHELNKVRRDVPFRAILQGMQDMYLTTAQTDYLNTELERLVDKRNEITDPVYSANYSKMIWTYITFLMNDYIDQNANFSTASFYGFGNTARMQHESDYVRTKWLLDNDKFDLNYSSPPGGLSLSNTMSVMHETSGTTMADFIFNGSEIIFPAMAIFAVLVSLFCVFQDIKQKTILGAIASRYSRRRIIWSKAAACMLACTIVMALFWAIFLAMGAMLIGSVAFPPTIIVTMGVRVIQMTAGIFLLLQFVSAMIAISAIVAFVTLFSTLIQNWKILYPVAGFFALAVVLLEIFLSHIAIFTMIFYPLLLVFTAFFMVWTDQTFARKEFL